MLSSIRNDIDRDWIKFHSFHIISNLDLPYSICILIKFSTSVPMYIGVANQYWNMYVANWGVSAVNFPWFDYLSEPLTGLDSSLIGRALCA